MKQLKLFTTALWISSKHSSRGLLCLLCMLLLCGGLAGVVAGVASQKDVKPVKTQIAVINYDSNPLTAEILKSLGGMDAFLSLIELEFYETREQVKDVKCVIIVPEGFLQSILDGGNLSPTVEYDATGVMESLWARQLAVSAARALSAAQQGVYAVQEQVAYGVGLDNQTYQMLLAGINVELMRTFLVRDDMMQEETLSASGALSLPQYYLAAVVAAFFFGYAFLFYPASDIMYQFAKSSRSSTVLFFAQGCHILLLYLVASAGVFCLLAGEVSAEALLSACLFALLCTSFASVVCQLFSSGAACAVGCILVTVGMALCAGLLIPLPLMPQQFSTVAQMLPVSCAMRLAQSATAQVVPEKALVFQTLLFCLMLTGISAVLWWSKQKGARR